MSRDASKVTKPPGTGAGDDYPRTESIDGIDVTFRPMVPADKEAMLAFARSLPESDLLFLRTDITRNEVVDVWMREIDGGQTVTIAAEVKGVIAGYCSLHHSESLWTRHLGEILLLVGAEHRGHGLGGWLARQILELAKRFELQKLVAQMTSTQRDAQHLFHDLGFIPEAMLHDWVIDRQGRTHNLIMMSREVDPDEDFFADLDLTEGETRDPELVARSSGHASPDRGAVPRT
ncbi:MAG: GNAT family N-acetyltransferase [Holophagales bacterium]|nr:GNAT family N-acetyltransferase [Holophagales bacterium]